jgi:hypothetical protein
MLMRHYAYLFKNMHLKYPVILIEFAYDHKCKIHGKSKTMGSKTVDEQEINSERLYVDWSHCYIVTLLNKLDFAVVAPENHVFISSLVP